MEELSDQAVRHEVGMSAARASRFAGVSRVTLEKYEIGAQFVSDQVRPRCERFYALLRSFLAKARGLRG